MVVSPFCLLLGFFIVFLFFVLSFFVVVVFSGEKAAVMNESFFFLWFLCHHAALLRGIHTYIHGYTIHELSFSVFSFLFRFLFSQYPPSRFPHSFCYVSKRYGQGERGSVFCSQFMIWHFKTLAGEGGARLVAEGLMDGWMGEFWKENGFHGREQKE